jgi:hypothetical protein
MSVACIVATLNFGLYSALPGWKIWRFEIRDTILCLLAVKSTKSARRLLSLQRPPWLQAQAEACDVVCHQDIYTAASAAVRAGLVGV